MRTGGIGATAAALTLVLLGAPGNAQDRREGYLAPGEFDVSQVVEPAPRVGDPRYETDRAIFRATRKLRGTSRWDLAIADADYSAPALMHDFSCAVGAALTPETAPKTLALVQKAGTDTARQSGAAKNRFQRARPFTIDRGPVCEPLSALYDERNKRMSYDYPSGHSTWGWTWALVLASAVPERAQAILNRGRSYADSRFVCGSHNESAVEAGMLSASAVMTVVGTKPDYQRDLAATRAELAALRASGAPAPQGCEAEAALIAQRVMPRLDAAVRGR